MFAFVALVLVEGPTEHVQAAECAQDTSAAGLHAFFGDGAAGLAGADYPHAYALPDGRTLWLFQDAFQNATGQLVGAEFKHNTALVQTGNCFEHLPATGGKGTSWVGSWVEDLGYDWFWPMDAEIGSDGHLWLFLASMRNDVDDPAGGLPTGTWRARLELPSLRLVDLEPANDSSDSMFGYSIVSDREWTYLFANCYRQYTTEGFDSSCSPHVYLARVPKGRLDDRLEYWTGSGWSIDRGEREPVMSGDDSLAASIERFGDTYVAVSDDNEWFGSELVIRTAKAPQGPWSEVSRFSPEAKCQDGCNNYGPFILPHLDDGKIVIAHSNNAWDMPAIAFPNPSVYRISVHSLMVPGVPGAPLPDPDQVDEDPSGSIDPAGAGEAPISGTDAATQPAKSSPIEMTLLPRPPSNESSLLATLVELVALSIAVALMATASLGVIRVARRVSPSRRRRALARIRTERGVPAQRVVTDSAGTLARRPHTNLGHAALHNGRHPSRPRPAARYGAYSPPPDRPGRSEHGRLKPVLSEVPASDQLVGVSSDAALTGDPGVSRSSRSRR